MQFLCIFLTLLLFNFLRYIRHFGEARIGSDHGVAIRIKYCRAGSLP